MASFKIILFIHVHLTNLQCIYSTDKLICPSVTETVAKHALNLHSHPWNGRV